jgi:hypothetical protein
MPIAAYEYLSDNGTLYQVNLPSDFAASLGYVPATGSEPFLPAYINCRYATYQTYNGALGTTAVIVTPFSSGNPPNALVVGAEIYELKSSYGEQRNGLANQNAIQPVLIQGPAGTTGGAGPAGPQGPPGVAAYISAPQTTQMYLAATGDGVLLAQAFAVPAGTYLIFATADVSADSGGFYARMLVYQPYAAGATISMDMGPANNGRCAVTMLGFITIASPQEVDFQLTSLYGSGYAEIQDANGNPVNVGMTLLKVA